MSEFDHGNVLTLIGVCFDGNHIPNIVIPLMRNGSLLSYIKNYHVHPLTIIKFAMDVAHGIL